LPGTPPEIKVNIGCGLSGIPGWHNLDNSPTILLSRVPFLRKLLKLPRWPDDVRKCDVRRGLPFADGSVRYIYSSHAFEHFTHDASLRLARECFRVLEPGGIIRVAVPDLRLIVNDYLSSLEPNASHAFISRLRMDQTLRGFLHPGSHHSQMFDYSSLVDLLRRSGFADPEERTFRTSAIPNIESL